MAISLPQPPGRTPRALGPTLDQPFTPAPLDLHEGILDPSAAGRACGRWPEHLTLANLSTGEVVAGRCKATNLCRYCQRLYVVETVEMLSLDATEYAPTIWVVLTAREHLARRDCDQHLWQLRKAARRHWPDVEWFVQVEFQRRGALHLNLLVKGVPDDAVEALGELLTRVWCARVDARPVAQWIGLIDDPEGTVRYLQKTLAHGLKREQAPPIGWRGHRTSQTRGYLVRPAGVMREEARRSLRLKRLQHAGLELGDALIERHVREQHVWKLARHPGRETGDVSGDSLRGERFPQRPGVRVTPVPATQPLIQARAGDTGLPESGPKVRPGGDVPRSGTVSRPNVVLIPGAPAMPEPDRLFESPALPPPRRRPRRKFSPP